MYSCIFEENIMETNMKLLIFGFLLTTMLSAHASSNIKNVIICSVTCSSAGYHIDHNSISNGTIFFAAYNEDNASNSNVCSSEARALDIATDRGAGERSFGIDVDNCSEILLGKYSGKKVMLVSEKLSNGKTYITKVKTK
jgi:hypothetical protein